MTIDKIERTIQRKHVTFGLLAIVARILCVRAHACGVMLNGVAHFLTNFSKNDATTVHRSLNMFRVRQLIVNCVYTYLTSAILNFIYIYLLVVDRVLNQHAMRN